MYLNRFRDIVVEHSGLNKEKGKKEGNKEGKKEGKKNTKNGTFATAHFCV